MLSPVVELMFNTKKAPFDNVKVRQAISYAIDRKFVIDNIWFGFGKPTNGPISSNFAPTGLYTADVTNYNVPDGVDRANKLLDEPVSRARPMASSSRSPMTSRLMAKNGGGSVNTPSTLARIGIKANLRYEDVATWLKRIYTDYDYDVSSNHLFNLADPVLGVHRAFHSRFIRPGTVFVNAYAGAARARTS